MARQTVFASPFAGIAALCLITCVALGDERHRAVSFTPWNDGINPVHIGASIDRMQDLGVTHVGLNVFWFQDTINSTAITPDYTRYSINDTDVRNIIQAAHARGMEVMLKPNVELRSDPTHWRGDIPGSSAWFTGYQTFINHFATIAEEEDVALLSVGCELIGTDSWEQSWRDTIAGVRAEYSGELVYSALFGAGSSPTHSNIQWWDALDHIGIDAYYQLTSEADPTQQQLDAAWVAKADLIEAWRGANHPDMKVLFTEGGYRSDDTANMHPWEFTINHGVDLQEQAECYEALLGALWDRPWFEGIYWWQWDLHTQNPNATTFSPEGKPAADVMAAYYTPEPSSGIAVFVTLAAASLRRRRQV